ncbi:MAG: hypothetical protein ACR2M7_02645 [Bdellovibrionales bacterium]
MFLGFAEGKTKNKASYKKARRSVSSQAGFVLKSNHKIFKNLSLKRGDFIESFNKKDVASSKDLLKKISHTKKSKKFSIKLKRKSQTYLVIYKKQSKSKYQKVKTYKVSRKKQKNKKTKTSDKNSNAFQKIISQYKGALQKGYVTAVDSLIYKGPDFDTEQIFYLRSGNHVTMSKKIFTPSHGFGTFYKVFIKKPKIVIGYVSEVDVIPEYKRKTMELNSEYVFLKKQIDKTGRFKMPIKKEGKAFVKKSKQKSSKGKKNRYVGISGGLDDLLTPFNFNKHGKVGFKLSGFYFIPLEIDLSLVSSFDLLSWNVDFMIQYPFLAARSFLIYVMGGIGSEITRPQSLNVDVGPALGLSLAKPFSTFLLRIDGKMDFYVLRRKFSPAVLISFQKQI